MPIKSATVRLLYLMTASRQIRILAHEIGSHLSNLLPHAQPDCAPEFYCDMPFTGH